MLHPATAGRPLRRLVFGLLLGTAGSVAAAQGVAYPAGAVVQPLHQANDPAERLAAALRTLAVSPNNLAALLEAGRDALTLGDPNAAVGFFGHADEVSSRNGQAKAGLGAALVQLEKPQEALRYFADARALGVSDAELAPDRGLAYDLIGEPARAQRDYLTELAAHPDDEATRRALALSQGIAGDRKAALATLDPLIRKRDIAAWRAQTFVLAMTGDSKGANAITRIMLPQQQAALQPFLERLATLSAGDKARAVHFGEINTAGRRAVATASVLPVAPAPRAAPVQVAQAAPASDLAMPIGGSAASGHYDLPHDVTPRRRSGARAVAAGTSPVLPAAAQATLRRPTLAAAPATRTPTVGSSVAGVTPAVPSQVAVAGSSVTVAGTPAVARASATGPSQPAAVAGGAPAATLPRPGLAAAPVAGPAVARTYPVAPSIAGLTPLAPPAMASAGIVAAAPAAATVTGEMPATLALAPAVGSSAAAGAPSVPATVSALPQATTVAGGAGLAGAADAPSAPRPVAASVASLLPRSAPPPPVGLVAVPGPAPIIPAPPTRTAQIEPGAGATSVASANEVRPGSRAHPATPAPPTVDRAPAPATHARPAATARAEAAPTPAHGRAAADDAEPRARTRLAQALDREEPDTPHGRSRHGATDEPSRRDDADQHGKHGRADTADADAAAETTRKGRYARNSDGGASRTAARDNKPSGAADRDDGGKAAKGKRRAADGGDDTGAAHAKAGKAGIYVQVAGGANRDDMDKAWSGVRKKAPELMKGRTASTTPVHATNRLLVGPFKSEDEAQGFVNKLAGKGVSGFVWKSSKGQAIDKVDAGR